MNRTAWLVLRVLQRLGGDLGPQVVNHGPRLLEGLGADLARLVLLPHARDHVIEELLVVGEALLLEDLGPLEGRPHLIEHERDPLGLALERHLGHHARGDRRPGGPQGRATEPGIAEVAHGLIQCVPVLDLLTRGVVSQRLDMPIVEGLVFEELLMDPGVMDEGRLMVDLPM